MLRPSGSRALLPSFHEVADPHAADSVAPAPVHVGTVDGDAREARLLASNEGGATRNLGDTDDASGALSEVDAFAVLDHLEGDHGLLDALCVAPQNGGHASREGHRLED